MIVKILPAGLAGLTLAGVFSVMMSSADSYLLLATQSIIGDIMKPALKNFDDKKELQISKICNIIFGILAFITAMFFHSAYDA